MWSVELKRQLGARNSLSPYMMRQRFRTIFILYRKTIFVRIYLWNRLERRAGCRLQWIFHAIGLTQCSFAVEDLTKIHRSEEFDFILFCWCHGAYSWWCRSFSKIFIVHSKKNGQLFINTPSNMEGPMCIRKATTGFCRRNMRRNGYGYGGNTE